jgi:hypothetical protein
LAGFSTIVCAAVNTGIMERKSRLKVALIRLKFPFCLEGDGAYQLPRMKRSKRSTAGSMGAQAASFSE